MHTRMRAHTHEHTHTRARVHTHTHVHLECPSPFFHPSPPSFQGVCEVKSVEGTTRTWGCRCNPGFSGLACSLFDCPNKCSFAGTCLDKGLCSCYPGESCMLWSMTALIVAQGTDYATLQ